MTHYYVEWVIDADADTPLEAAQQAREHQTRKGTTAVVFHVSDGEGNRWQVDLLTNDVEDTSP